MELQGIKHAGHIKKYWKSNKIWIYDQIKNQKSNWKSHKKSKLNVKWNQIQTNFKTESRIFGTN